MTFTRAKSGGWVTGERLTATQMNTLDTNMVKAVDGDAGGTYTPSSALSVADLECPTAPSGSNDVVNKTALDEVRLMTLKAPWTPAPASPASSSFGWDDYYKTFIALNYSAPNTIVQSSHNAHEAFGTVDTVASNQLGLIKGIADNGSGISVVVSHLSGTGKAIRTTDGASYSAVTIGSHTLSTTQAVQPIAWNGSVFMLISFGACEASSDGSSWSAVTSPSMTSVAADPVSGDFFACHTTAWAVSTNAGSSWTSGTFSNSGTIASTDVGIVYDGTSFLVAGEDATGPCIFAVTRSSPANATTIRPSGLLSSSEPLSNLTKIGDVLLFAQDYSSRVVHYFSIDNGTTAHLMHSAPDQSLSRIWSVRGAPCLFATEDDKVYFGPTCDADG